MPLIWHCRPTALSIWPDFSRTIFSTAPSVLFENPALEQELTMNAIISGLQRIFDGIGRLTPDWLIALLARGSVAYTFWSSGRSKVSGFLDISESTFFLFEH